MPKTDAMWVPFTPVPLHEYDHSGDRFGRVCKSYLYMGELRRQKKKPNKEVFYTFVWADTEHKYVLRSLVNCSNDQLVDSIRRVGEQIETHAVNRPDGEEVLDFLYAELGRRSDVTGEARARSKQDQSNTPVGNEIGNPINPVSNG